MFEITGDDVARLGDADLRTLVARLALAELTAQGLPRSAVTAGGHQDAGDGGIDVRVETTRDMPQADFVPRGVTGYQVKRPDMTPSEIVKEMRYGGSLRPSIAQLAADGGSYVIVSAQGSVADHALKDRREALRKGLEGCPDANNLHTDFYDRGRVATWTNLYPGAAAWVRARIGAPMSGWQTIGKWVGTDTADGHGYLVGEDTKVVGERTGGRDTHTVSEGLDIICGKLRKPGQSIRLVGMSGVGKTRFVQALFEDGVGTAPPLDPALSLYTDFAEDISPSAREMARRLVDAGQRAILVIDNCNPAIHGDLAEICTANGSRVSLLTVEYDVRDDEPERTEVFRLTSGVGSAVEQWIAREFPHVSQIDRRTIAGFSDGNFRVARALAETVRRGEGLGNLRSHELFERLFTQRNTPDQRLLRDAEILALAYSFDGEDELLTGELAALGSLAGRSVRDLFGAVAELRSRGIVQSRGRWRAVLPQAIANRLAANALRLIPPGTLDGFWRVATARLVKSVSRRLGYLHDSTEARATVVRWLNPTGPVGNLFDLGDVGLEVVANLAPASPEAVLAAMRLELDGPRGAQLTATSNRSRFRLARLLRALAYAPESFHEAATLLARLVAAEPEEHNSDSARDPFSELFHIHLSGTRATPQQRIATTRSLLTSGEPGTVRAGRRALDALLKTSHFSSSAAFDFGARPRDFGWHPATTEDIERWFGDAIDLAMEVLTLANAKAVLGRQVGGIWRVPGARGAIEAAADRFIAEDGGWIDGWIALRAARRWGGAETSDERLDALIERLQPANLLQRSRAVVLTHGSLGYDVSDTEDGDVVKAWHRASDTAVDLGKAMAVDGGALAAFLPELLAQHAIRSFEFGKGLALGSEDQAATWQTLADAYAAVPEEKRNVIALGGYLAEFAKADPAAADGMLEAALGEPALRTRLPFLQSRTSLDANGLDRLRRLAESGDAEGWTFGDLASGVIDGVDPEALVALLRAVEPLERGTEIAIDALHFRLHYAKEAGPPLPPALLEYGREILLGFRIGPQRQMRDHRLGELAESCFAGAEQKSNATAFCQRFLAAVRSYEIYTFDSHSLIEALLKVQPIAALDALIDPPGEDVDQADAGDDMFDASVGRASPLDVVDTATLIAWADVASARRYPRLGRSMSVFETEPLGDVKGLSAPFLTVLTHAPDKAAFLGNPYRLVHPSGWSGSLAANLAHRKSVLAGLSDMGDAVVDAWLDETNRAIDRWIAAERDREHDQEESFE